MRSSKAMLLTIAVVIAIVVSFFVLRHPDDTLTAEYTTAVPRTPRSWTLRFYASGKALSYQGDGLQFSGTYSVSQDGNKVVMPHDHSDWLWKLWRFARLRWSCEYTNTYVVFRTNGTEYLVLEKTYGRFERSGSGELLNDQFRKIR